MRVSQPTFDALVSALQDHMRDEGDAVLTDWYLVAAGASLRSADSTLYVHLCSDTPYHSLLGLVGLADAKLNRMITTA